MTSVSRCRACGAFIESSDRFCWSCGLDLVVATAAPAQPVASAEPALDPAASLTMRRAYLAQQRGRWGEAERLVREVLAQSPDSIPALSALAEILRARGDLIGSVAAAQRVSELAAKGHSSPGSVARAREERAGIEQRVMREVTGAPPPGTSPLRLLTSPDNEQGRVRTIYGILAAFGAVSLALALAAVARGQLGGHLWFGASLLAAGWCYHDAEARGQAALFWAPFVLCLGPFGLSIYLLATH